MNQKRIIITRDSVAAGDDADAPHEITIEIDENDQISKILDSILLSNYLPKIRGGKATWSLASNNPLAIVAQEWPAPKLICMPEYPFPGSKLFYDIQRLHFNYHTQEDPEIVFKVLRNFRTADVTY